MHFVDGWGFFGMHVFWWLFWLLLIVAFLSLFTAVPKDKAGHIETPLDILQHRYAAGEITTAEYQERRGTLTRDKTAVSGERSAVPMTAGSGKQAPG